MDMFAYEDKALQAGYKIICGIDEAGRGPLAGPVFAAAVVLDRNSHIDGINDSKKLSEKKREYLFDLITEKSLSYAIGSADEKEIDEINILNATMLAMKRAVENLDVSPDYVIVDGNKTPDIKAKTITVVKGDALSYSVAAASILAKVSRDRYMKKLSEIYPAYNFAKHKGYGTKEHRELIMKYGPCEIHRKTFLKFYYGKTNKNNSTKIGKVGEDIACKYLRDKGYTVLTRNYHTRFGELDIIASDGKYLVFVEVKSRKKNNNSEISPKLAVDKTKQDKLIKSSAIYISEENDNNLIPRFDVIEVIAYNGKFFANHIKSAFSVEDEYEIF